MQIPFSHIVCLLALFVVKALAQYGQPHQHQPAYGQQQSQHVQYQQQQQYGQPQQSQHVQYQQPQHVPQHQQVHTGENILHERSRIQNTEHLKEHISGVEKEDLSKMSEEELQFHYFKMHDNDNNNKLDGSELIKSLIHWHVEESKHMGVNAPAAGTTKVFTDTELEQMIDPILEMDDKNKDGYIDYPEFIAAQKSRGF